MSGTTTRLVLCHSWYTEEQSRGQAMFLIRWFLIPMIRPVLDNMRETEVWLESECDKRINWSVVRPAGLTNNPRTDKEFKVEMDKFDVSQPDSRSARCYIDLISLSRSPAGPGGLPEPTWRGSCCPVSPRRNTIRKESLLPSDLICPALPVLYTAHVIIVTM